MVPADAKRLVWDPARSQAVICQDRFARTGIDLPGQFAVGRNACPVRSSVAMRVLSGFVRSCNACFVRFAWGRTAWTLSVRSMGKASAFGNDAERRGRAFPRGAWERERLACPAHRSFNRNMAKWPCTILGGRASVRAASKPGSVGASPSPFHASPFSGSSTADR
jgi:hypothetical protein